MRIYTAFSPDFRDSRGTVSLTDTAELALHFIGALPRPAPAQARRETLELHQVCDPEERAPLADDDLRIRGNEVRPLRRNRANAVPVDPQQEPLAGSVVPLPHADELLSGEWVERMRYTHKARGSDRRTCILS